VTTAASGVLKNDTDAEHDKLTAVLDAGSTNGAVTLNADGSFTYTPNAGFTGTDSLTYQVSDGILDSALTVVTLNVAAVPSGVADQYTVNANKQLSVVYTSGVLANDTGTAGDTLTAVLDQTTTHGVLSFGPKGGFVYTPTAGFVGNDTFTYTPLDGNIAGGPTTVTISVLDTPPVAKADTYQASKNVPLSVGAAQGVLINDTDVQGNPLTALLATGPAHGVLTLNADGSFLYTPNANFSGTDSFTYQANDGTLSSTPVVVKLTVSATSSISGGGASGGGGSGASLIIAETDVASDGGAPQDQPASTDLILGPSPSFTRLARLIQDSSIITRTPDADSLIYDADRGEFVASGLAWSDTAPGVGDTEWLLVDDLAAGGLSIDPPGAPPIAWDEAVA
jgi:VCBS repeat-containing protein